MIIILFLITFIFLWIAVLVDILKHEFESNNKIVWLLSNDYIISTIRNPAIFLTWKETKN